MLRQAQHKNQGGVPAACAEPVEAMENPALDWRAVLEMYAGRTQERMLALSLPKGCSINRRRCTELVEVLRCASRTRQNWMLALRLVLSLSKPCRRVSSQPGIAGLGRLNYDARRGMYLHPTLMVKKTID
jgi:hypothetical protein